MLSTSVGKRIELSIFVKPVKDDKSAISLTIYTVSLDKNPAYHQEGICKDDKLWKIYIGFTLLKLFFLICVLIVQKSKHITLRNVRERTLYKAKNEFEKSRSGEHRSSLQLYFVYGLPNLSASFFSCSACSFNSLARSNASACFLLRYSKSITESVRI